MCLDDLLKENPEVKRSLHVSDLPVPESHSIPSIRVSIVPIQSDVSLRLLI